MTDFDKIVVNRSGGELFRHNEIATVPTDELPRTVDRMLDGSAARVRVANVRGAVNRDVVFGAVLCTVLAAVALGGVLANVRF